METPLPRTRRTCPGPNQRLRLPPAPDALLARPGWWYHRLGIEGRRAEALRTVARHADRMLVAGGADRDDAADMHDWLQRLPASARGPPVSWQASRSATPTRSRSVTST